MRKFIAAIAVVLAGCSMSADTRLAEQAVVRFHEMLDAGQSDAIYSEAADELKKASTRQEFVALLDAVHRKLGDTRSSDQKGWNVNYQTSGAFVTLNYQTAYAKGNASEQFVYRLQDSKALLAGYHINSNALIIN